MDDVLTFVLKLYRLAQESSVVEFPDLALTMLKAVVPFQGATWSEAQVGARVEIFSVHLHNEPEEVRAKFSRHNSKHTRRTHVAARQAGHASVLNDTAAYFCSRDEADMRAYIRKYRHERNLLITDRRQWLSLYRPMTGAEYSAADAHNVGLLWSHLAEALTINRALTIGDPVVARHAGARALIDRRGVFLYSGMGFVEALREEWSGWSGQQLPAALLEKVLRGGPVHIAEGRIEVEAQDIGNSVLLTVRRMSLSGSLSPRELAVAQEFSEGKSYKTIARDLQLAPATVRNVLQKAYRKLDIDNKAALVRLFERERRGDRS